MAKSTGIVLAAGGIAALDQALTDADQSKLIRIAVGTVGAALVSAGLDKIVPGFGTGIAAVLVSAVVLDSGPRIVKALNLNRS